MANLKEIRTRMASVKTTRQVTSAMKMVSASKLRRAQNAVTSVKPYSNKLFDILANLSETIASMEDNIYSDQRSSEKILLVSINSNRGLCGAFNSNVNKKILELINTDFAKQHQSNNLDILAIGKNTYDFFRRKNFKIKEENNLYDNLNFEKVSKVAETVMQDFKSGKYDKVYLVYNSFKNAATQVLKYEQFLPIVKNDDGENKNHNADYIFEPSKEEIINGLIPNLLKMQFYKAILDSNAAEHGARMTAMHQATDNATSLLRSLNLQYNKARQTAITNEILEIVSGSEALNG